MIELPVKVFLGGTCNGSNWREELIPLLNPNNVTYFNPVVENWTPECQEEEIRQRQSCFYCLYVITPKMTGFYSIAEVVDDSNKRPRKTILCVIGEDKDDEGNYIHFTKHQAKSLIATEALVTKNGGLCVHDLQDAANYMNGVKY